MERVKIAGIFVAGFLLGGLTLSSSTSLSTEAPPVGPRTPAVRGGASRLDGDLLILRRWEEGGPGLYVDHILESGIPASRRYMFWRCAEVGEGKIRITTGR